jgi:hypothetical protein
MPLVLILIGASLRTAEYLHNKAIWLDEAHVVLNVLQRGYIDLLKPLEFNQAAPYVFLAAERLMVDLAGAGEYSLRFIPWIGSLISLPLFWLFAKRVLRFDAALVALGIFAFSPGAIRYACEVKPYATDVVMTLVLMLIAQRNLSADRGARWLALLAIAGGVAVWCSYTAIFVLAGIGITLMIVTASERRGFRFVGVLAAGLVWLASFGVYYMVSIRYTGGDVVLRGWWSDTFMPLPPKSLADFNWFLRAFFDMFDNPAGIPAVGIGAMLFVLGALSLTFRDRRLLLLFISPVAVALLASGLERYPFSERFLLFAVPMMLLVVGEGFDVLRKRSKTALIPAVMLMVMFTQPVIAGARTLVKSDAPQGVRPAYQYLLANYQAGDSVYLYHWTLSPIRYCMMRDGVTIPFHAGITARADWTYYIEDMNQLAGNPRVWLVFTNTPKQLVGEEEKFFLTWLDRQGLRLDELRARESSIYLYDLSLTDSSKGNSLWWPRFIYAGEDAQVRSARLVVFTPVTQESAVE